MAKAHVTCQSCGALVTIRTSKNRRDADRYAEYLESQGYLCDDCLAKQREEENAKAAAENSAAGLPDLTGTEKQIAWAETIRAAMLKEVMNEVDRFVSNASKGGYMLGRRSEPLFSADKAQRVSEEIVSRVTSNTTASWWIDNRSRNPNNLVREIADDVVKDVRRGEFEPAAEEAREEATIRPETEITEVVAEISATDSTITIRLPEKNEPFRELVKLKLGYRWDADHKTWSRKIDKFNGPIKDRTAEAANKILSIGVPVRVFDLDVRDMALQATFQPEQKRWLSKLISGEYAGWIAIRWGREDDLYETARSLPGSRYHKPQVVVPVDHHDALRDFADAYVFAISDGAEEAMQEAKAAHDDAIIATPVDAPVAQHHGTGELGPVTGEIDNDLMDDK